MDRETEYGVFQKISQESETLLKAIEMQKVIDCGFFRENMYLAQFEYGENGSRWQKEKNDFLKFLEYKDIHGFYGKADLDVSLVAMVTYCMTYDFELDCIRKQDRSLIKYEIERKGYIYRGDTMTSALTVVKKYLALLWTEIGQMGEHGRSQEQQKYFELFNGKSKRGLLYVREGTWVSYCHKHADIINEVMSQNSLDFLKSYMTSGNYLLLPGKDFNTARSAFGQKDTADCLLWYIYRYFAYMKEGEIQMAEACLLEAFGGNKQAVQDCQYWFVELDTTDWDSFVEKHIFDAYLQNNVPISLKTGSAITSDFKGKYNPMPKSIQECEKFFEKANDFSVARGKALLASFKK